MLLDKRLHPFSKADRSPFAAIDNSRDLFLGHGCRYEACKLINIYEIIFVLSRSKRKCFFPFFSGVKQFTENGIVVPVITQDIIAAQPLEYDIMLIAIELH